MIIRNGRYIVVFPESIPVPDWVVHEEIRHLGQAIETFGVKGVAQYEARNAAWYQAQRFYAHYTEPGRNLRKLAERFNRDPQLRNAFEESIRYLEIEPAAKQYARQQVRSSYPDATEWQRVVEAQRGTLEGYQITLDQYRALIQQADAMR